MLIEADAQRTGLGDGGEIAFRHARTAVDICCLLMLRTVDE